VAAAQGQRLGRCRGVITPQSHTMEQAVAVLTGATILEGGQSMIQGWA